jgi:folate-binding protein YgfZ
MGLTFDDEYDALHRRAVSTDRGIRDARLAVRGPDAVDWLQEQLTQEIKRLAPGEGAYAAYLTPQGRMVADMRVFHRGASLLLETPATARDTLLSRLDQFIIMEDVAVSDVSGEIGCLTVVGPAAADIVADVTGASREALRSLAEHAQATFDEREAFAAGSREFGVAGIDVVGPVSVLDGWRAALDDRVPRASDLLLETARIEAGRPRFGVDMHEDTIPLEAGIESRAINHDKGCYVGQEIVIRILHRGQGRVARRLVWVEAPAPADTPPWPPGTDVTRGDRSVGAITSACWSPARQALLGIAMVHRDAAEPDAVVDVAGVEARVSRLP